MFEEIDRVAMQGIYSSHAPAQRISGALVWFMEGSHSWSKEGNHWSKEVTLGEKSQG